jgi:hypothetical protein
MTMIIEEQPALTARHLTRGVRRALAEMGFASVAEFQLPCGRRADVMAVNAQCDIVIVEVKSSVADFRSDGKWPEYLDYCDRYYFAVAPDFPQGLIPDKCGLLVADAYGAFTARSAPTEKLNAARRKSLILQWGLTAAGRLHRAEDPGLAL